MHVTLYIIIYMSGPSTATARETEQWSMRDGKESGFDPEPWETNQAGPSHIPTGDFHESPKMTQTHGPA